LLQNSWGVRLYRSGGCQAVGELQGRRELVCEGVHRAEHRAPELDRVGEGVADAKSARVGRVGLWREGEDEDEGRDGDAAAV
jgi:hypothetical protein